MGHKSRKTVRISPQLRRGCGVLGMHMKTALVPKGARAVRLSNGAGDGNRTRVTSLGSFCPASLPAVHESLLTCPFLECQTLQLPDTGKYTGKNWKN